MPEPIGVIFDFDGVIADTEPLHERTLLEVAQRHGMAFTHDRYQTEYIGFGDDDAWLAIAKDNGVEIDLNRVRELALEKNKLFEERLAQGGVEAFPGVLDLAEAAASLGPVLICSGAARVEIDLVLQALDAESLFESIVSADDVEHAKPDPAGYAMACERAGLPTSRCVAIEDTPTGIRAAVGAGMNVLGVAHSVSAAELSQAGGVFDRVAQISVEDLAAAVVA